MSSEAPSARLPAQFYAFQSGIVLGYFALRLGSFAAAWWCLESTRDPLQLAAILALATGFDLVVGPLAAPLGDRFGGRLVQVTFVAQIVCFALLALAARGSFDAIVLAALLIPAQFLDAARDPVADAALPQLVGNASLTDGVRIRRALGTASRILGPAVGGAVTALLGASATFVLAVVALVAGALLCATTRLPGAAAAMSAGTATLGTWWRDTLEGLRSLLAIRTELAIAIGSAFLTAAVACFVAIAVPQLALQTQGAWVAGVVDAALGAGVAVAALFAVKPLNARFGAWRTVLGGLAAVPLAFALMAIAPLAVWLMVPAAAAIGFALVLVGTNLSALRLGATPEAWRTRIVANATFVSSLLVPLGNLGAGWLAERSEPALLLAGFAACTLVPLLAIPAAPHLRALLNAGESGQRAAYLSLFPAAFRGAGPRPSV
ncbi:hypothetical protein HLB44_08050 [Aquincola sp. S2]|uniref:MFS transporter n=1 Tax=Pseudaquabacterium terrae TaxID=2732868 RepID=A0ABX2EE87_9BURK|nr:hypothetical protein [Aquabacterium terrae]NRF66932.1 hypothetical protein [Aquabacterium terrae]